MSRASARAGSSRELARYIDSLTESRHVAPGAVPALRRGDGVLGPVRDRQGATPASSSPTRRTGRERSSTAVPAARPPTRALDPAAALAAGRDRSAAPAAPERAVHRLAALLRGRGRTARSSWSSRTCTGPTTRCSTSSSTSSSRAEVPLLVVVAARPELLERAPGWGGGGGTRRRSRSRRSPRRTRRSCSSALLDGTTCPPNAAAILERRAATRSTPRSSCGCCSTAHVALGDRPAPRAETSRSRDGARADRRAARRPAAERKALLAGRLGHRRGLLGGGGRGDGRPRRRRSGSPALHELAKKELVRPPDLLDRRTARVRVLARPRARRLLRTDPSVATGRASHDRRRLDRIGGRDAARGPRRDTSPATTPRRSSSRWPPVGWRRPTVLPRPHGGT